jgi:hypothetical protein
MLEEDVSSLMNAIDNIFEEAHNQSNINWYILLIKSIEMLKFVMEMIILWFYIINNMKIIVDVGRKWLKNFTKILWIG